MVAPRALHADISRIIKYAPTELVGREVETQLLCDAWDKAVQHQIKRPHVLTFVALGGEGKTSLVANWAVDLAHQGWPGCEAVFAWSFYHQGTDEKTADSSDLFLKEALIAFGDPVMAGSLQHASDKGRRLAQLVGERRALLLLDGVEPLQYAPTSRMPGELKDSGISALLKGLATCNRGMCVLTTRYSIPDLQVFLEKTVQEVKLKRLSTEAGIVLLQSFGVKGSFSKVIASIDGSQLLNEFEKLVEDVKGHALTLNLLGTYLRDAHAGDIRKRDLVNLEEADAENEHDGHAFRVMDAYVQWFAKGGKSAEENRRGQRAIAVLQLLGLFDRPAIADCLSALLRAPVIPNLTEPFATLTEAQRNISFTRLEAAKLLMVNRDAAGTLLALDAHPLLREYFARQLRTQHLEAWRAAHQRLYEHLCTATKDKPQPTLEDLQPLYQAVAHGCHAGMQQEALAKVYRNRILRGQQNYSTQKLGASGSNLGAIACFFEQPWSRFLPALRDVDQAWLLNEAAYHLRSLGRLAEAHEPMRAGLEMRIKPGDWKQEDWQQAAISANNLSELELMLGDVAEAIENAEQCINYADHSGDMNWPSLSRIAFADALHQADRRAEAQANFCKAEAMQAKSWPDEPLLYSTPGFKYCDLLLSAPERAAWQWFLGRASLQPTSSDVLPKTPLGALTTNPPSFHATVTSSAAQKARRTDQDTHVSQIQSCRAVFKRTTQNINKSKKDTRTPLLVMALDHLTLGRALLYEAILECSSLEPCHSSLQQAVDDLRRANTQHWLPAALLTRAWMRSLTGASTGPESAQSDLDEAWEIAERGPMRLFLVDIHLYRARLFGRHASKADDKLYPWKSPAADLTAAHALIVKHGYLRRFEEVEEALHWI